MQATFQGLAKYMERDGKKDAASKHLSFPWYKKEKLRKQEITNASIISHLMTSEFCKGPANLQAYQALFASEI